MQISKDLVAASSTPLVLSILAEHDSYGYELVKTVKDLSGGHLQWTEGMLYPLLHRLEKQNLVTTYKGESPSGRTRKYYAITEQGLLSLEEQREQWAVVTQALRAAWNEVSTITVPTNPRLNLAGGI